MEILGDIGLGKGEVSFLPQNLEGMGKLFLGTLLADIAGHVYLQTGKVFGLLDLGEDLSDVIGGAGLYASKYAVYLATQYLGFDEEISTGAFLTILEDVGEGVGGRIAKSISDMLSGAFGEEKQRVDTTDGTRRVTGTVEGSPYQYQF